MALAMSLVLLVVCTISGLAMLRGTRLNELMASNAQQENTTFEGAESAIAITWKPPTVLTALQTEGASDRAGTSEPVLLGEMSDTLSRNLGQDNRRGSRTDIGVEVSIQYCGETSRNLGTSLSAIESEVQLVGVLFDSRGVASITSSRAHSDHVQRGYITRPASGRQASCDS